MARRSPYGSRKDDATFSSTGQPWLGREAATQRVKANLIAMKLQRKKRGCRDRDLYVPELLGMKKEKGLKMWPRKQNEGPTFFSPLFDQPWHCPLPLQGKSCSSASATQGADWRI